MKEAIPLRRMIFPGSFDPLTLGHFDVLRRARALCDELVVAVLQNPVKAGVLTPQRRMRLIEQATEGLPGVRVVTSSDLLVEVARQQQVGCIVRGLRTAADSAGEIQMAQLNRILAPELEVLMMPTAPEYAFISSSFVRDIAARGGDIRPFVPPSIAQDVQRLYQTPGEKEAF